MENSDLIDKALIGGLFFVPSVEGTGVRRPVRNLSGAWAGRAPEGIVSNGRWDGALAGFTPSFAGGKGIEAKPSPTQYR